MNSPSTLTRSGSADAPPLRPASGKAAHEVFGPPAKDNPFSSRRVRPGAIPFHFQPGVDAAALVARLAEIGWRAAIVGPHGTGKSTLFAALLPELQRTRCNVHSVALHDGERRLPAEFAAEIESAFATAKRSGNRLIVVVDGYEQLSRWNRWRLRRRCRAITTGLLVTSHADVPLPVLFRTKTDVVLAEKIVSYLLRSITPHPQPISRKGRGEDAGLDLDELVIDNSVPLSASARGARGEGEIAVETISLDDVHATWRRHDGNLRETLFDLYDLFEQRRHRPGETFDC